MIAAKLEETKALKEEGREKEKRSDEFRIWKNADAVDDIGNVYFEMFRKVREEKERRKRNGMQRELESLWWTGACAVEEDKPIVTD